MKNKDRHVFAVFKTYKGFNTGSITLYNLFIVRSTAEQMRSFFFMPEMRWAKLMC